MLRARAASGTIVNVSSVNGKVAQPLAGFYAATKHALEAMSEALYFEVGHFGIRTIIIEPGYFMTSISDVRTGSNYGVDGAWPYDELRARRSWPRSRRMANRLGRAHRTGARGGGRGHHRRRHRSRPEDAKWRGARWAPTPRWCSAPWARPARRRRLREARMRDLLNARLVTHDASQSSVE